MNSLDANSKKLWASFQLYPIHIINHTFKLYYINGRGEKIMTGEDQHWNKIGTPANKENEHTLTICRKK